MFQADNYVDLLRKKMWKEEKINYRHVLEIKKLIEGYLCGEHTVSRFLSMYISNIEDYQQWKELQQYDY